MKKEELAVFYKIDKKSYLVSENETLKRLLDGVEYNYQEEDIQGFINKLIAWYSVKFSEQYILLDLKDEDIMLDNTMLEIMSFDRLMNSFHTVELEIFQCHQKEMEVILRYLVEMAGCGLIYSRKSKPNYGYYRANKMFEEFNDYFGWGLDVRIYDSIMERDYSLDNEDIKKILEKRRKANQKKATLKRNRVLKLIHSLLPNHSC